MLHDAIQAFVNQDAELARKTIESDEAVDLLRDKLTKDLTSAYKEGRLPFEALNPLIMVARRLERVSDQARNISMETLYMCTGEIAKHPGSDVFQVLFVDEHNACRSVIAETIGTALNDPDFVFSSAGLNPAPVTEATIRFMASRGFDVSRVVPRALTSVANIDHEDVIVLLAPEARQAFPRRPRHTVMLDWSVDDPSTVEGDEASVAAAYQRTYSFVEAQIRDLVSAIRDTAGRMTTRGNGTTHELSRAELRLMPVLPIVLNVCVAVRVRCRPPAARSGGGSGGAGGTTIQVQGSDTMVNVAQAWAEEYAKVRPDVGVEVSGGGSGVGIAALEQGTIDIANASRNMKPEEIEQAKKNTGKEPKEFIVGYDALAVYVHKDNPLNEITIEQLAEIFAEDGKAVKWSDLGVTIPGVSDDTIVRVSRQSSSGTYEFFREHVLGKKDFKLGSRDMNGSKEVVELVGSTRTAIGYSGMGYATPAVKMLKVAREAGEPAYEPSVANTLNKTYPLARSLQVYTLGEPQGAVKDYIDWILSPAGQKILEENGYVPVSSGGSGA